LQHVYLKILTVFQLTIKMFLIMSCNLSFTGEERGIYKHAFRSILYGSCVLVFSSSRTTRSYFLRGCDGGVRSYYNTCQFIGNYYDNL